MQRQPVLLEHPSSDGEGSRDAPKYGQVQDLLIGNPLGVLSFLFVCLFKYFRGSNGWVVYQAGWVQWRWRQRVEECVQLIWKAIKDAGNIHDRLWQG